MSMKILIEINESTLKSLVLEHVSDVLGEVNFSESDIKIEVKSKQNYKSEWEMASYRATVNKNV